MTDMPVDRAERIGRYIDGEMDGDERAAFEAELVVDPELAEAVALLSGNDERLRAAFALPVDDALLARLGLADSGAAPQRDSASVIDLAAARAERAARTESRAENAGGLRRHWRWTGGLAMAATVALAVALPLWRGGSTDPASSAAFQLAMETAPSRSGRALAGGSTVAPQLSFADRSGRYCREYVLTGATDARGIACRAETGGWRVEAQVDGSGAVDSGGGIRTAAGQDSGGLDAAYDRLGASDPFDLTKENALRANGWRGADK